MSDALSPLKRAFLALEDAQARLGAAERAAREPIAVIGLSCRVPGADDAEAFWRLMREGRDAIGPVPAGRWDADALFDPDPDKPGRIVTREGGFLANIDRFDPGFFGIAPREAQGMDPQQRILLEVAWEALEHAGQPPDKLERSATGVYVGMCSGDYAYLQLGTGDTGLLDAHFTSGIAHSIASGRLSYLLGLQGPSLTIDTACSSSLVAVHLACQALRAKECRMALAGGVNLILSPDLYIALSHSRMLAPDGRCKTFDAAADGFARGEGCGVVVLKRLSDAQADGDRILALIRATAVNQDGPSSGLTAPNGPAQEAVVREALARAGLVPKDVGYLEAHGTGTQLGDPLEVAALGAVFGADRDPARPLLLGSVKTNVGHLEGAAGVTGLIKLVLSLVHREIPPHLHFTAPSPHIPWADLPLRVPTALAPWEPIAGRRIAGVSSFGFSGTNAHAILEEAPGMAARAAEAPRAQLFPLSARDEGALAELARRHAATPGGDLADVCYTAGAGRAHFAQRATVLASSMEELRARLGALAAGGTAEGLRTARVTRRDPPRVAFLFTGQGAQYPGMARGLYETSPVFREALGRCATLLAPHLDRPLLDTIFAAEGPAVDDTTITQPALFAVEYALAELLRSWGVVPVAVMGHSVGELVAACIAGVFSLEDGLRLTARRGRLMGGLPAGGAMAAIFAPEDEVAAAVAPVASAVSIAAVNGPGQTVISGRAADVQAVCDGFTARKVRCQPLPVSHAFHSPLVDPILDAFEKEAATIAFAPPRLRLVSNLTGGLAEAAQVTQAGYWRRHVREPVRFADGLRALVALRPDVVVELGPQPTLLTFARATLGDAAPALVATLRKGKPDAEQLLDTQASLYLAGADLDWRRAAGAGRRVVDLPSYPFQRERFWFQARPRPAAPPSRAGHPLLGARLRTAAGTIFEARVGADSPSWVRQHQVLGHVVLPATAYLEILLAAGRELFGEATVLDVTVKEPMILAAGGAARLVQLVGAPAQDNRVTCTLASVAEDAAPDEAWTEHVSATLRAGGDAPAQGPSLDEIIARCPRVVSAEAHYAGFVRRGLDFGDDFKGVRRLWRGATEEGGEALGEVELVAEPGPYLIHPVLLDGCLQVLAAALSTAGADEGDALYLPIAIERTRLHRSAGGRVFGHVVVRPGGGETRRADLRVLDAGGAVVAELGGVLLKRATADALARIGDRWLDDALYQIAWRDAPPPPAPAELARAGGAALDGLRVSAGLDAYDAFLPRLEALCVSYVLGAVQRLGWTPAAGERVDAEALATRLGVAARHRRLFVRLLAILAEAGWITPGGTVAGPFPPVAPERELATLRAAFPAAAAELEMTGRAGGELAEALRGEREAMQLLFPGGSLDTAERMYRDAPTAKVFNGLMAEVLVAAASGRSTGRPLRILEIGAGTGGTTAHVMPRLPAGGVEYTFTDVGPLFVARARERFGSTPFMRFAVLDLERDPEAQGFAAHGYDVVIASNVIHATADLRRTLARVRRLLVPGGLLAMLEVTAPQRWFDLTVGLTDGWWAFSDTDLRPDYPTMPRARWLSLLAEQGFTAATALPQGDGHAGTLGLQSLLLARSGAGPASFLLVADRGGTAAALAARLGERCAVAEPGTPPALAGVTDVVHLTSLDAAPWEQTTSAALAAAEAHGPADLLRLARTLVGMSPAPRLWIVTRGGQPAGDHDRALAPAQAPVWGLAKALRLEHPELTCVCVDLDPAGEPGDVDDLLAELGGGAAEPEVALRGGRRRVARLARARSAPPAPAGAPYRLVPSTPGSLDALVPAPLTRRPPGPGEVEIAVEATGLNFKDVLNVLGMYPGDPGPLGGECAGRVVAVGAGVTHVRIGDEVMAVAGGSFASHVTARAELVQPRPPGVSADEGASFPIPYLTAEFCLGHLARMGRGDRVLVHAAAGGVGLAAVKLAQRAGAEVFATAGSPWKRELLRSLGVTHVHDSRSAAFADEILAATGGRGADVVLNSLTGELIEASFRCLARGGRFVEIGKRGIKDQAWVAAQDRDLQYFVVDWGITAAEDPALVGGMFARLAAELRDGALAPLPRQVFALHDAAGAFRFMAQARHAGKIVVRQAAAPPAPVRADGTYLVTGGLSGLGPVVARWLGERGAGRVVLIGRRGVTAESAPVLDELRARGVDVVAEALDVTDETGLERLLARLRAAGPPLRGVIHGAGVLDDAALLSQDAGKLARVTGPKVRGGWLLDRLTRRDPLDWFVLFSSVASVLGSPGQANHSAANAFLDLLAHERRGRGLPGLSINWGAWTQVGAAADRGTAERVAARGMGTITPAQGLRALERLLAGDRAQVAVLPMDWGRWLAQSGRATPPFLAEVAAAAPVSAAAAAAPIAAGATDLRRQLEAEPPGRWRPIVATFVRERALKALGLDPSRPVDPRTPLGELGLDSLLAVELRNTLGTALGKTLPASLLFDYPTIDALTEHILETVAPAEAEPAPPPAAPPADMVGSIEDLSDEEVERQLAARAARRNA